MARGSEALHRSLPSRCLGAATAPGADLWSTVGLPGEKSASSGDFIHRPWITLGISPSRLTGPGDARHSAPTPQTEPAKSRRGRRNRGNSGAAEPEGEKREAGATPGIVEAPTGPSESGKPGRGDTGGDELGDRGGVGEGADVRPSFSGTGPGAGAGAELGTIPRRRFGNDEAPRGGPYSFSATTSTLR